MRYFAVYFIFIFASMQTSAQSNIEIFLFDLEVNTSKIDLKNGKNISINEGYDNQPSFINDRYILFAATRNAQTDIVKYDMQNGTTSWLNSSLGGEYTPLKIPHKNEVSAVRLDPDGLQRLYAYDMKTGASVELIKDLVVAYYIWYDDHTIVSCLIEGDNLNLYVTNLKTGKSKKYDNNVGRSFHKIPNSNLISFVSKNNETPWQVKSLNITTGEIKVIADLMKDVEDMCWIDARTMLAGDQSRLFKLTLNQNNNWTQVRDLSSLGIKKISRIAVNASSSKLVIAVETNALPKTESILKSDGEISENTSILKRIVQNQIEAYNTKNFDAFMALFAENIILYKYPNTTISEGKNQVLNVYSSQFYDTTDLNSSVVKRIAIGNKVIDEMQITRNGKAKNKVIIYEIENERINKVTFLE